MTALSIAAAITMTLIALPLAGSLDGAALTFGYTEFLFLCLAFGVIGILFVRHGEQQLAQERARANFQAVRLKREALRQPRGTVSA